MEDKIVFHSSPENGLYFFDDVFIPILLRGAQMLISKIFLKYTQNYLFCIPYI